MNNHCSYYLKTLFTPELLQTATRQLCAWAKKDKIAAVAGRGTSGVVMASALAAITGLKLIVIRKPGENTHADFSVEYRALSSRSRIAIVDDFVASGNTLSTIVEALHKENLTAHFLYLYAESIPSRSDRELFEDLHLAVRNIKLTHD